jgi:hypothetical protein
MSAYTRISLPVEKFNVLIPQKEMTKMAVGKENLSKLLLF